jgi:hypothetical protein
MIRVLTFAVALGALVAVAAPHPTPHNTPGSRAKCRRDAKGFVDMCAQTCDAQLRQKKPQSVEKCRKICKDQRSKYAQECEK